MLPNPYTNTKSNPKPNVDADPNSNPCDIAGPVGVPFAGNVDELEHGVPTKRLRRLPAARRSPHGLLAELSRQTARGARQETSSGSRLYGIVWIDSQNVRWQ